MFDISTVQTLETNDLNNCDTMLMAHHTNMVNFEDALYVSPCRKLRSSGS